MQKHKENESDKFEKEINILSQKCVELETNRLVKEKEHKQSLQIIKTEIDFVNKDNELTAGELDKLKQEYELLLKNKESSYEDTIEKEEKTLEDLREKYNLLLNESQNVTYKCEQFDDPNFIFMTLSNWDVYFLNKFLVDLNNHIHGEEN